MSTSDVHATDSGDLTGHLNDVDRSLVQLYIAASSNQWGLLAGIAKDFYAAGGTLEELRGCIRHLVVLSGYGPCLAATFTLQKAKLIPENTPGKVGGPPGNAFNLVYDKISDTVKQKVHSADPVLGEWIQMHLYGDVYSSPGIDMRVKQLLMCARLAQADMPEQLFGHALAAFRFGNTPPQLQEAISIAYTIAPCLRAGAHNEALTTLNMAVAKYDKDFAQTPPHCPVVTVPDLASVCIPELVSSSGGGFGGGGSSGTSNRVRTGNVVDTRRFESIEEEDVDDDDMNDRLKQQQQQQRRGGGRSTEEEFIETEKNHREYNGGGSERERGLRRGVDEDEEEKYKDVLFAWEELELERER